MKEHFNNFVTELIYEKMREVLKIFFCSPVGRVVFGGAGNVLGIVCEFILLDFGLQVLRLGPAGPWAWTVAAFAV